MIRSHTSTLAWCSALAWLATTRTATAQLPIHNLQAGGVVPYSNRTVADSGDVDGDGVSDLLVAGYYQPGSVRVYSGRDGALIREHLAGAGENYLGFSVAALGDLNNDGRSDYAFGIPYASVGLESGRVRVMSGRTGELLHTFPGETGLYFNLGWSVARCGDVDGDGTPDLVDSSGNTLPLPTGGSAGRARVRSGATGAVIWIIEPLAFGPISTVSGAGDLDADGRPDFLVGSPFESPGAFHGGTVRAYSGSTGLLLWSRLGDGSSRLGFSMAPAGDVDHDGHDDVVAGAPYTDTSNPGRAYILSGATGVPLRTWIGSAVGDRFGWSVDGGRDWNGDGTPDVVLGAPWDDFAGHNSGTVRVASGADGSTLAMVTGSSSSQDLGRSVCFADLNFDGRPELVAQSYSGRASVWLNAPSEIVTCPPRADSTGCAVTANVLGTPSLSLVDDLAVGLRGLRAHQAGMLFFGPVGGAIPFHGGTLCVGTPRHRSPLLDSGGTSGCTGTYRVPLPRATLLALGFAPGATLHAQFVHRDLGLNYPDNVVTSGSVAVTLLP